MTLPLLNKNQQITDEFVRAVNDLIQYADMCELLLQQTYPGKADALAARIYRLASTFTTEE